VTIQHRGEHTYAYNVANQLTARSVSDGRSYTYDWSQRGQLLAENIQGVPVCSFVYDAAGQMIEATVFTQTTTFSYTAASRAGAFARVRVGVAGYDPVRAARPCGPTRSGGRQSHPGGDLWRRPAALSLWPRLPGAIGLGAHRRPACGSE